MLKNSKRRYKSVLFVMWIAVSFTGFVACACSQTKDLTEELGKAASSLIHSETKNDALSTDDANKTLSSDDTIPDSEKTKAENEGESEKQDKPETDGGGNKYYNESERQIIEIEVLVSEAEYICNNKPITLEELLKKIKESKADVIVKISDHNATYKAYNSLIDLLVENGISYLETD